MKTERALARLASNHLDEVALAELYRNDKEKNDGIVTQWFGKGTIATDALSRVMARIAKNAVHFCPKFHKPEDFILGHAIQECQRLYSLRLIETVRKTQSRSHLGNLQIRFGTAVNADAVTGLHVSF